MSERVNQICLQKCFAYGSVYGSVLMRQSAEHDPNRTALQQQSGGLLHVQVAVRGEGVQMGELRDELQISKTAVPDGELVE